LWLVKVFQQKYAIDMNDAEKPLNEYTTIAKLFTRKVKARPIDNDPPVHPVDGRLTSVQHVEDGHLYQIKGWAYDFSELTKKNHESFREAAVLTYYLCPTDYHRVHSPVAGTVRRVTPVSGELWPVNSLSVESVKNLFVRNERVIIEVQTLNGLVLLIMVGATNVGKISLSFDLNFQNRDRSDSSTIEYAQPIEVKPGDELGIFHMGSTVLVVYPKTLPLDPAPAGSRVRMGQSIRRYCQ
jgi:phosphatidylserine decarboxylase